VVTRSNVDAPLEDWSWFVAPENLTRRADPREYLSRTESHSGLTPEQDLARVATNYREGDQWWEWESEYLGGPCGGLAVVRNGEVVWAYIAWMTVTAAFKPRGESGL